MRKILIVDDEVLVRMGFRSVLDWEACGYTVVGDACSGAEALQKIPLLQPDLIFTDLRMADGDGFLLMRTCQKQYPQIKFIVLSSYNDFDNVREALRCGALDYVFKLDVKPEQLRKLLAGIPWEQARPQAANPHELHAMKTALMSRMLANDDDPHVLQERFHAFFPSIEWEKPFCLITIAIDNHQLANQTVQAQMSPSTIRSIETVLEDVMGELICCCPLCADQTLLLWQGKTEMLAQVQEKYTTAADYIKRYLNCSVTAVMSAEHASLAELATACSENEQTLSERYLLENGRIHGYHPPKAFVELPEALCVSALENVLSSGDEQRLKEQLGATFSYFGKSHGYPMAKLRSYLLDLYFALKRTFPAISSWVSEEGYSLERMIQRSDRLSDVRIALYSALDTLYAQRKGMPRRLEMVQIVSYAREHIAQELSVAQAAQQVKLSESYFSHIFKREMGMGFTEWLNRERVLKAQQLLHTTDLRVNEIAQAVGIENANYFSALFRKLTGKTPLEEREGAGTKAGLE
ncbi:MAG: AraC family transcriptional regulator [Clostridia bacterium]